MPAPGGWQLPRKLLSWCGNRCVTSEKRVLRSVPHAKEINGLPLLVTVLPRAARAVKSAGLREAFPE